MIIHYCKEKIKINFERGFVAFISVVILASFFLAIVLAGQENTVQIFESVNLKTYRGEAANHALFCLNQAVVELTHDYFYSIDVTKGNTITNEFQQCSIISVSEAGITKNSIRHITVLGTSEGNHPKITARIDSDISLVYQKINLISATTTF